MEKESFVFYKSFFEAIRKLKAADKVKVYDAICELALEEKDSELTGMADIVFTLIRPQIKANNQKFKNGLKGAESGKKGGRPKKAETLTVGIEEKPTGGIENNKEETPQGLLKKTPNVNVLNVNENVNVNVNDKKKAPTGLKKKQAFSPPSLTEVKSYCSERENNVDPQGFIDFYEAKGWMIGKNKMKDWKAAVRTWERKEREDSGGRTTDGRVKQNQTPWDELLHTEYI